jgi:hypothetical protein
MYSNLNNFNGKRFSAGNHKQSWIIKNFFIELEYKISVEMILKLYLVTTRLQINFS